MPKDGIRSPFDKTYICPTPKAGASDFGGMGPTQEDEPKRTLGETGGVQFQTGVPGAPGFGESLKNRKVSGS